MTGKQAAVPGDLFGKSGERWWHRFQGVCPHGLLLATIMGDSPTHPEQLVAEKGLTYESPMLCCEPDCRVTLTYVRSWNHEPSEAEIDAVTPADFD